MAGLISDHNTKSLPLSERQRLLGKLGANAVGIQNYRPVSLLVLNGTYDQSPNSLYHNMAELISVHHTKSLSNRERQRLVGELGTAAVGVENYGMSSDISSSTITDTHNRPIFVPVTSKDGISKTSLMNLQWKNICLTTKCEKKVLKDLSGEVRTGELTAIMGPSGAGKTMLLNVLSGFNIGQKASGSVTVDGFPRDTCVFRKLSCYVMQDDLLLPRLTVRECVSVAACLKIPDTVSGSDRRKAVDACLESLGLSERQHHRAAQLSGGQRKRLCIAQQLVSNPRFIFLDEPTSGLDSSSSFQCIQLLKSLAKEGRTVVCSIHQPSARIFEIFDKLYVLADGHCIYRGPLPDLIPFLSEQGLSCPTYHSPADFVIEVASGSHGDHISRLKAAADRQRVTNTSTDEKSSNFCSQQEFNSIAAKLALPQPLGFQKPYVFKDAERNYMYDGYATGFCSQLTVLTYRSLICIYREPINSILRFTSHVTVGVLLGVLYYGIGNDAKKVIYNTGLIFFSLLFLIFSTLMPTALIFPMERHIFTREYMNSWYSLKAYYMAKTIAEIPFQIVFPVIYCTIVYWMTSQPNDLYTFCVFTWNGIMIAFVSHSVGLLIGAAVDAQNAVFLAPAVTVPFLLMSGFFISLDSIPACLRWLSSLSYIRYCYQSILEAVYSADRGPLDCLLQGPCPFQADPMRFLEEIGVEQWGVLWNSGVVLAFLVAIRGAAFCVLWIRVADGR